MRTSDSDIYDYEAGRLINWLYCFLGPRDVDRALAKHEKTLRLSGPVVSEYSLQNRHPWWPAFLAYFQLKREGKSIKKNLTPQLKILCGDAKRICSLLKFMPLSVQKKYRRDLMDVDRARDYLFEIHIAWHFYLRDHDLQWYEDDGQKHPEFLVKTPTFDFNVECKRISVDTSKQIRRDDFYRLVQDLVPEIGKKGYTGNVDVIIPGRLHSGEVKKLASDILELIKSGMNEGEFRMPLGQIVLTLTKKTGRIVNVVEAYKDLRESLPDQGHASLFSSRTKGDFGSDPIALTIKSDQRDKVLDGISSKIRKAGKDQLDTSIPGMIVCFLEDVYDLSDLRSDSGLQRMTSALFEKKTFSHIAAVSYSSEIHVHKLSDGEMYDNQSLVFKNPNCRFEEAKAYRFTGAAIE
jgi:hypothetical protein